MAISRRKIIKANQEYYFQTYAKAVTRVHWGMSLIIIFLLLVMVMVDVLAFLRVSFIRQSAQQFLEIDVAEWADRQLLAVRIILILIFVGIASVAALWLWYYWKKVKSYDLYKQKKRYIWIVAGVAIAEIAAASAITGFMSQSGWTVVVEILTLVVAFLPMLSGARLLIPWEVTPLPKKDVEFGVKVLNVVFDWFSTYYLDKE